MASGLDSFPEPIFVGGPGRSGTHVVGRLIAAHPRYHLIRTEARFHASPGGLPDLIDGRARMEDFLARMRGRWWRRGYGQNQGLTRIVGAPRLEAVLTEFEVAVGQDRVAAARGLVRALLDPAAEADGKPAWVEVSGGVIESAPVLLRLFPAARFVNMVRDGRAVAAGTVRKINKTDDPLRALAAWERTIRGSDRAVRALPPGRILTVGLEDLAAHRREASFARLCGFLEIDDDRPLRAYFDEHVSAAAANVGRWRERMAPQDARRVDRRYRRLVRRLHDGGADWVPEPEPARLRLERLRPTGRRGAS